MASKKIRMNEEGTLVEIFSSIERRMLSFHDGHRWGTVQKILANPQAMQARFAGWQKAAIRIGKEDALELVRTDTLTIDELKSARDAMDGKTHVIVIDNVQSLNGVMRAMVPARSFIKRLLYGKGGFQLQIVSEYIDVTKAERL